MKKVNYLLVNVFADKGYSFVLYNTTKKSEKSIIDACIAKKFFKDKEDAENCSVIPIDEKEMKEFVGFGNIYDL